MPLLKTMPSLKTMPLLKILTFGLLTSSLVLGPAASVARSDEKAGEASPHVVEVRTILLDDQSDRAAIDRFLRDALIPALRRHQTGPVGVFSPAEQDETGVDAVFVVIPYPSLAHFGELKQALDSDKQFAKDAADFLSRDAKSPAYRRIRSELLGAMDCWPETIVRKDVTKNPDRVFELRVYESANRRLGDLKVDMFNAGEVPIFLDCDISPVFIGQCLVGPQMPNLTYLTVYANDEARQQAWKDFLSHPDWKQLRKNSRYAGTVSRIDKFVLKAKPYSQM